MVYGEEEMMVHGEEYELASYGEKLEDGSRQATIRLVVTPKFDIGVIEKWVRNRINNYGRNETLAALQKQLRIWEDFFDAPKSSRKDSIICDQCHALVDVKAKKCWNCSHTTFVNEPGNVRPTPPKQVEIKASLKGGDV